MTTLRVIAGVNHGKQFDLQDPRIVVGRDLDCNIRFPDSLLSRHHAELIREGDTYLIRDLNSTNGSYLNTERITEARLTPGDTIRLADIELAVVPAETEPPEIGRAHV